MFPQYTEGTCHDFIDPKERIILAGIGNGEPKKLFIMQFERRICKRTLFTSPEESTTII
jgi:hypothetical protein